MANFTPTTGADTVVGSASDDTVNGTAATLNAGDSLTGGAGTDVLALYGSGAFWVEGITLNNFTSGSALFIFAVAPTTLSDREKDGLKTQHDPDPIDAPHCRSTSTAVHGRIDPNDWVAVSV
jgi:hypothetical protein